MTDCPRCNQIMSTWFKFKDGITCIDCLTPEEITIMENRHKQARRLLWATDKNTLESHISKKELNE